MGVARNFLKIFSLLEPQEKMLTSAILGKYFFTDFFSITFDR